MKRTATIILNRNLKEVTERLYEQIHRYNADTTDIYVVESGSAKENLSKYCSWWADWPASLDHGLRFPRGFNFALTQLYNEDKYSKYDYFYLLCNDAEVPDQPIISELVDEIEKHPRVGILSPCSRDWGEHRLLKNNPTQYFWYVNHIGWFIRREFIDSIRERDNPTFMNFLYDGENFRGYESEIELIVKGYANDWATAITTRVLVDEDQSQLITKADLIKTEPYEESIIKCVTEGKKWMRRKYGFNSRWTMQMYAKFFYESFFENYPELRQYKI